MNARLWRNVPHSERSKVRSYINSEQEADREEAQRLCRLYSLEYQEMRTAIMREMIAESERLGQKTQPTKDDMFTARALLAGHTQASEV